MTLVTSFCGSSDETRGRLSGKRHSASSGKDCFCLLEHVGTLLCEYIGQGAKEL